MSKAPIYTEYHPKWHRRRMSTYWWLGRWPYVRFILRELSSVAVAYFVVILLLLLRALIRGPEAYAAFLARMRGPVVIALNLVAFCFLLFHAITWFNLAPKAMVVRVGGKRVPDVVIAGQNYVAWIAISALVVWLLVWGW